MNTPMLVAGVLLLVAAVVHGLGGELLVVRRLPSRALPSSPFGGPSMTKTMISVTWHLTTIAFVELGALEIYAAVVSGGASRGVELLVAGTATAFAALAIAAALRRGPAALFRHVAPFMFAIVAGLTWWGTL